MPVTSDVEEEGRRDQGVDHARKYGNGLVGSVVCETSFSYGYALSAVLEQRTEHLLEERLVRGPN